MRSIVYKVVIRGFLILALILMILPGRWIREILKDHPGNTRVMPSNDDYVPNIVHFIRFGGNNLTFIDAVCMLAALKNQRPLKLYVHTDQKSFHGGKYWEVVVKHPLASGVVEVKYLRMPRSIFGKGFNPKFLLWHASDVERLRILIKYGGIYLDNDSYIVKSLSKFFNNEMTLGWEPGGGISDQVLIAKRNARFLRIWLDSYRDYRRDKWFYNGGELPTKLLKKHPSLAQAEHAYLAEYKTTPIMLYFRDTQQWLEHYAIHLLINHQYILTSNLSAEATYPVTFNETNILKYPASIRQMALDVYPYKEEIRQKFAQSYPYLTTKERQLDRAGHPASSRWRRWSTVSMDKRKPRKLKT